MVRGREYRGAERPCQRPSPTGHWGTLEGSRSVGFMPHGWEGCRGSVGEVAAALSNPMGVRVTRGMSALSGLQMSYTRALFRAFLT